MRSVRFRKREEIFNHLTKQRESGVPVESYCSEHGIASSTFFSWRKRYPLSTSTTNPAVKELPFGRITVSPSEPVCVEVTYKDISVHIPVTLVPSTLRDIITVLHELN